MRWPPVIGGEALSSKKEPTQRVAYDGFVLLSTRVSLALASASLGFVCFTPSTLFAQQAASMPESPREPTEIVDAQARFGALRASPSVSDVHVASEAVSMQCEHEVESFMACEMVATWTLTSESERTFQLYASAPGFGEVLLATGERSSDAPQLHALDVHMAAGERIEVTLRGQVHLRATEINKDALRARHPFLQSPLQGRHATIAYTRAVSRTFADAPENVQITSRVPEGHSFDVLEVDADASGAITLTPRELGARASIPFRIEEPGGFDIIRHGGPFIGIGGTFDQGFRGRLGYEIGFGEIVILGIAADADFQRTVTLGAVLEVATPSYILPPSFSVGAGFAYRLEPRVSAGLRLEAGAVFEVLGITASFDYFPDDAAFTSSLMGRLSI